MRKTGWQRDTVTCKCAERGTDFYGASRCLFVSWIIIEQIFWILNDPAGVKNLVSLLDTPQARTLRWTISCRNRLLIQFERYRRIQIPKTEEETRSLFLFSYSTQYPMMCTVSVSSDPSNMKLFTVVLYSRQKPFLSAYSKTILLKFGLCCSSETSQLHA